MTAGDATTLHQVSLASLLGLDARALLTTDDPATHLVYRRVIERCRLLGIEREKVESRNIAIQVGNVLVELFAKRRG